MRNFFLCLCLLAASMAKAQKHDYKWITGIGLCDSLTVGGTSDFGYPTGDTLSGDRSCRPGPGYFSQANAFVSDSAGNLRFYTNGCHIFDSLSQIVPNGDSINYGDGYYWDLVDGNAYYWGQGCLFLPFPGRPDQYALFHQVAQNMYVRGVYTAASVRFEYTVVDGALNGGLGAVVERETLLSADTLPAGSLTACRHANGRDWWVLMPEHVTGCFHLWLFGPDGPVYQGEQCPGFAYSIAMINAQSAFSPDGEWYARNTAREDLTLYRFDRRTGTLTFHQNIPYVGTGNLGANDGGNTYGVSFSPSCRYLYASTASRLFQFDLWAADIAASRVQVDSFVGPIGPPLFQPNNFAQQFLGSDGRIYLFSSGQSVFLHRIAHPDSLGLVCGFGQRAVPAPSNFSARPPNFPHFRSGPVEGSACDTLGLNSLSPSTDWLDFGSVPPGGDSLRGFWARSHVGYPATVRQLDLPAGSAFAAGPLAPLYAIPKYDSVWVPVRFAPLQPGAFEDTLYLRTNYGHIAVRLTGTSDTITSALPAAPQYSALRLWPNPTAGNVQLSFSASHAGETLLTVHDALGRIVLALPVPVVAGSNRFALPLEGLPGGVYLVMLRGVGAGRVVKN